MGKKQKVILVCGVLLLGSIILVALWPRDNSLQERTEALLELGYTFEDAERAARAGVEPTENIAETPVSTRLPEGVQSPLEELVFDIQEQSCEGVEDSDCSKLIKPPKPLIWNQVNNIIIEFQNKVVMVSWRCLRTDKGQWQIAKPLFSEFWLEGNAWRKKYLLRPGKIKDYAAGESIIRETYRQLPDECKQ